MILLPSRITVSNLSAQKRLALRSSPESQILASRLGGANNAKPPLRLKPLTPRRTPLPHILDTDEPGVADALFSAPFGLFGRQKIRAMIGRKLIRAEIPS